MSVSPETLAAFADGQLEGVEHEAVARAVATDPDLARQVQRHRALRERLIGHYAPVMAAPLPDALVAAAGATPAPVTDLAAARTRRKPWIGWGVGLALAASLTLALLLPRSATPGYADGALASALDNQLSGEAPAGAPVRVVISFADASGALCRGYASGRGDGIACRDGWGWKLARPVGGAADGEVPRSEYRQAGSADAALMAAAQDMAQGPALDAGAERAARAAGWRRR